MDTETEKMKDEVPAEAEAPKVRGADQLVANLFKIRDIAHALHLKTKSFSAHVALNTFYDELLEKTDELAETYAGVDTPVDVDMAKATIPAFDSDTDFIKWTSDWAHALVKPWDEKFTHLNNIWDEIMGLVDRTKYKLENLK